MSTDNDMLTPFYWSIENVFDQKKYNVPVYQRPYSWESKQINTLLDDLFLFFNNRDVNAGEEYYVGNIMIHNKNKKLNGEIDVYDVVDGQQRITTFALILLSIYSLAKSNKIDKYQIANLEVKLWPTIKGISELDNRTIDLNSVEKDAFSNFFDSVKVKPEKAIEYVYNIQDLNAIENIALYNFKIIYNKLKKFFDGDNDKLLSFLSCILKFVKVIVISVQCPSNKVFSMFSSLNSKGKKLDQIDIIKTFIFSQISDPAESKVYLTKWGKLIKLTNDKLYEYLCCYIKAFIFFFPYSISNDKFEDECGKSIKNYFETSTLEDTVKKLLDDLEDKVEYYIAISNPEKASGLIGKEKIKVFIKMFNKFNYQQPSPLLLRTFYECDKGLLKNKEEAANIIKESLMFMIKVKTISNKDGKAFITTFEKIMNEIYNDKCVSYKKVNVHLINALKEQNITNESLKSELTHFNAYDSPITFTLLALYYSCDEKNQIRYDAVNTLLIGQGEKSLSVDHMLFKKAQKDDPNYKYYYERDEFGQEYIILKDGHDFPIDSNIKKLDYYSFLEDYLNNIGNLRILERDINSARNNKITKDSKVVFHTYAEITKRSNELSEHIIKYCLS